LPEAWRLQSGTACLATTNGIYKVIALANIQTYASNNTLFTSVHHSTCAGNKEFNLFSVKTDSILNGLPVK
jgi:hypothetical protein